MTRFTTSVVASSTIVLPTPPSQFETWELTMAVGGTNSDKRALIADLQSVIARYRADGVTYNEVLAPVATPKLASGTKCPHCERGVYEAYKKQDAGCELLWTYWQCQLPGTRRRNADCLAPNPEPTLEKRQRKNIPRCGNEYL